MSGFDPTSHNSALESLRYQASMAHHQALARSEVEWPRGFIREVWAELKSRSHNAAARGSPVAERAAVAEALAVMTELSQLSPDRARALSEPERRRDIGGGLDYDPEAINAAFNKAVAALPALARLMAERAAAEAERQQRAAEAAAAAEAQRLRALPADLLASLRRRGVRVGLTDDGRNITARPGDQGLLQPSEIATLKERKADVVALLKAEVAAATPVVIA